MLSTGSQGEPMAAISLMAAGDSKFVELGPDDVVIIRAHPIPGNEWSVGRVIDELHRRGAEVDPLGAEAVHVTGHARQGELAHAAQPDAARSASSRSTASTGTCCTTPTWPSRWASPRTTWSCPRTATSCGSTPRGSVKDGEVPAGYLYVDGAASDIDHGILRDRKVLASEGMVMVVASVDLHAREITAGPEVLTRGWAGKDTEELLSGRRRRGRRPGAASSAGRGPA